MRTGTYSEAMQRSSGWLGWVEYDGWMVFVGLDGQTFRCDLLD